MVDGPGASSDGVDQQSNDLRIDPNLSVSGESLEVVQQVAALQVLFSHHMERPALLMGKFGGDSQLAANIRSAQLCGGFDLQQPAGSVPAGHQKIRDDVRQSNPVLTTPTARFGTELKLHASCCLAPGIPDGTGLFLDVRDQSARTEDQRRCCFQLALAAQGPPQLRVGDQHERTGRPPSQSKRGKLRRVV